MIKQTQNSIQLSAGLLLGVVVIMALFFSSCKKKEMLEAKPTYTVTFNSRGGSPLKAIKVKHGDALILPANPTKNGLTFGGWYTDSDAIANPFSASTTITNNLILYAKWNAFTLSSASFADGGEIPLKYARPTDSMQTDRLNISPQLNWTNIPRGTTSFLIIMEDTTQLNAHWCVYNIPANISSIAENAPLLLDSSLTEYVGPWGEAPHKKHIYQITIFALNLPDNFFNTRTIPLFEKEAAQKLKNHILARAYIKGKF